jgi:predicted RNase H-like HicB family nuclease
MLLFVKYMEAAMSRAQYEVMEDGDYWAEIPGFQGVWGTGKTIEESRAHLEGALEAWLLLGLWQNDPDIPVLGKLSLIPRGMKPKVMSEASKPSRDRKAS